MLKRLQSVYAHQAVRFLLVPCNQFGAQEPKSNAEVKQFAEQYVNLGPGSNVVMLAKSNLNGVPCGAKGVDVCTPLSTECCPVNDHVYNYLLEATPPGKIVWNFDKIVVDTGGQPMHGETVLHGADLDDVLAGYLPKASSTVMVLDRPLMAGSRVIMLISGAVAALAAGMYAVSQRRAQEQQFAQTYLLLA